MDLSFYKEKCEPIDGKWYFNKELGSGAFGRVFEIERRDFTNDKSALKIITIPSSSSEVKSYREENYELDEKSISSYFYGFVEEFTKEFALMTTLKGQNNIVRIEDYDVKEHSDEIGWDIFIRMELLTPMNRQFSQNAPGKQDVIRLGIDICKALEVCKEFNVIHRDIKPSNIFISQTGEYKLGDFGVARTLEKTASGLSKKDTYTYMAPEVFKGEAYGSNVDIYSLGIVMYKLLNNNMEPFRTEKTHADEENALGKRMTGETMPPPANADSKLAEIILKACSFNPGDRYESPAKMRAELEALVGVVEEDSPIQSVALENEAQADNENTVGLFGESTSAGKSTETEDKADSDKTCGIFSLEKQQPEVVTESEIEIPVSANNHTDAAITDAPSIAQTTAKTGSKKKRFIIPAIALCLVTIIAVVIAFVPPRVKPYRNSYETVAGQVEIVDETGYVLVNNADFTSFEEGMFESGHYFFEFYLTEYGGEKLKEFAGKNPGKVLDVNINGVTITKLTINSVGERAHWLFIVGSSTTKEGDGFSGSESFSRKEFKEYVSLLHTDPTP